MRGWEVMVGSKSFFKCESSWCRGDMRLTSMTRYNIKEIWWHSEVALVNLEAVKWERVRIAQKLKEYPPRNHLNVDETGLFGLWVHRNICRQSGFSTTSSAPPDRGLSTQQRSGKKSNCFCITVTFICNQDGTEKWPIFYIGKSKQPRYFGRRKQAEYGFHYHNNKTAWMTAKFFEEWIIELNQQFQHENWHVTLMPDNFSSHSISYEPTNIELIYLEPNLTPYVQPLDAGIIHCMKAHYWRAFCTWAVNLDEAGEPDIYKINLLEVMVLVRQAWDAVSQEMIANCWRHTGMWVIKIKQWFLSLTQFCKVPKLFTSGSHISNQHSVSILDSSIKPILSPTADPAAWSIIEDYASGVIESFPDVEERLNKYLGVKYQFTDWQEAFMAINHAEDDTITAVTAIKALASKSPLGHNPHHPLLQPSHITCGHPYLNLMH